MSRPKKRLYKYIHKGVFAGVLYGFAKYFNIDVILLRVAFVFFVLMTGFFPGVVAYIIAIFIMPPFMNLEAEDVIIKDL